MVSNCMLGWGNVPGGMSLVKIFARQRHRKVELKVVGQESSSLLQQALFKSVVFL